MSDLLTLLVQNTLEPLIVFKGPALGRRSLTPHNADVQVLRKVKRA